MAIFVPHPSTVQTFRAYGTGNMGDVTDVEDRVKFGLDVPFVLILCRFWAALGTGSADLALKQQLSLADDPGQRFNQTVRIFSGFGTDGTAFMDYRVQADEYAQWSWPAGALLVPEWTNPASGTMTWHAEFRLAPIEGQ